MSFKEIDLDAKIEEQKVKDPDFAQSWNSIHESEKEATNVSPRGQSFDDFLREYFTEEEIKQSDRCVKKMLRRDKRRRRKFNKHRQELSKKFGLRYTGIM